MNALRQRANELLLRLANWSTEHPEQAWTLQVRIALDEIALGIEPALPSAGSTNPAKTEAARTRRQELFNRVVKHIQEHNNFDWPLASDIVQLMQDYAESEIK